ncbi:MAG: CoA pyrophosphatase [Halioglobus sp.]
MKAFENLAHRMTPVMTPWEGSGAQAAVLVALSDESSPRVLLGRRAQHLRMHPGEIAFPGGKRELEDETHWSTAMREAWEEVGIRAEWVTPLGQMEALRTRTGFEVHPCIAKVPAGLEWVVDPGEFDSVFSPPLEHFADKRYYWLRRMTDGGYTRMVPHFKVGEDEVWGVTAGILALLANVALDAGLDLKRDWKEQP